MLHLRREQQGKHSSLTKRHVAILISALGPGGAERVVSQLSQHWAALGHSITVFTFDGEEDPIYHELPDTVQLRRLNSPKAGFRGNMRRLTLLKGALAEAKPDLLISFLTKNNLLASLATAGIPLKWIACERNNPERQQTHPAWNRMLHIAYRRADAIVCQTKGVTRCFPASVQDRITIIPNPITPLDRKTAKQSNRIAAVGRLDWQKGFDLLIDAFAEIAPHHPDWFLDIWGSGPDGAVLENRISELALTDRISLRGTSDRPGGWLEETSLFVLSSRYEGFPNVLGEALSAGLPVIATDCDFGPSDMVTHGENGWLVPPESKSALAEALDRLMSDETLRGTLAEAAPVAAARFAPDGVMKQWDRLIDEVGTYRHQDETLMAGAAKQAHPAE